MKTIKIKQGIVFGLIMAVAGMVSAQKFKVESVAMILDNPGKAISETWFDDLGKCIEDIEQASQHPKTQLSPKMHYYYGLTYLHIETDGNDELKQKYPNALGIATDAFFKSIDNDLKKKYTTRSKRYLLDCAIGHFNKGVNHYNAEKYDDALASYNQAARIIPMDEEGELKRRNITTETLYQYSYYAAMNKGDNAKTKEFINKLIDAGYSDPKIYLDMVRVYLKENDTTNALKYIDLGKEIAPDNVSLINTELDIYLKQGRSQELIEKLDQAINADPGNKIYYFARAISYEKLLKDEKAEADYKKAIEVDDAYSDAYYNLGVIYINRCKPLAEQIDNTYDDDKIETLENQIDELYKQAATQFEFALEVGEYDELSRKDLMGTMKRIYARLMQNNPEYTDRYKDMKSQIDGM